VNSDKAWIALIGGAFAYNLWAGHRGTELLSGGAKRHRAAHPVLTRLFIAATIGHLTGMLPDWADPYQLKRWHACRGAAEYCR
jgi:hypothetical protein